LIVHVTLLRAVNVGGKGKLPMSDLKALCEEAGFTGVRTYIASGNVVFASDRSEDEVRGALERALHAYAGRPVGVLVRSGAEMASVLERNPFPHAAPERTGVLFQPGPPPPGALAGVAGLADEELVLGQREIYVHYPSGMGTSRLRIPAAARGTARNLNTVARLATMATEAGC